MLDPNKDPGPGCCILSIFLFLYTSLSTEERSSVPDQNKYWLCGRSGSGPFFLSPHTLIIADETPAVAGKFSQARQMTAMCQLLHAIFLSNYSLQGIITVAVPKDPLI